jgi:hypothetical protein
MRSIGSLAIFFNIYNMLILKEIFGIKGGHLLEDFFVGVHLTGSAFGA